MAVEALLNGEAESLTRAAVSRALAGDMTALRICMDRIAPPLKDRPVEFALPPVNKASDHAAAVAAVIEGLARGELTPSEAQVFVALMEQHRRSIELDELESRIAALEVK